MAFFNASAGNTLKYSQSFAQDDKVILNYYISFKGDMASEEKYSDAVEFAVNKIIEMVNVDTKMINESYNGDNLILYTGTFEISVSNNKITDEDKKKYNEFLNTDVETVSFTFSPEVYEISEKDLSYIKNNFIKSMITLSSVNQDIGYWSEEEGKWITEYKFEKRKYNKYYDTLRYYYYSFESYNTWNGEPEFRNDFKDVYLISNNYELVSKDKLIDILIKDKEKLIQAIYDNSPEIWNYRDININNYWMDIFNGDINVHFRYLASYTDYETGKEEVYKASTSFDLENSDVSDSFLREIAISSYLGI